MSDHDETPPRPPASPLSLAVWNFSSQWFLIPQGTGIISVILHQLDYQFNGLSVIAKIVWIYTIVQLGLCLIIYFARVVLYPQHVLLELRTSMIETSCLASISISFTSILQLAVLEYGETAGVAIYILWWINTTMAVIALLGIPYTHLKLQPPGIHQVPPVILLPFIAALTSAAGAGVICRYGHLSARLQVPAIIVAYLEVGAGLALATTVDALIVFQHFDRSLPPAEKVFQEMIICGPFGQGGFALTILGEVVRRGSFADYGRGEFLTAQAADPIGYVSQFLGFITWAYGIFWWCFAAISINHKLSTQPGGWKSTRFSLSAWSLVFPWVSYPSFYLCTTMSGLLLL